MLKSLIDKYFTKTIYIERPVFLIPPYFIKALKEYGVKEYVNGSNPDILKYLQTVITQGVVTDNIAWCSAFVNWVMRESGYPHTNLPLAKSWLKMGKSTPEFSMGSVVVLKRGDQSWQGHVGFAVCERDDKIYVLGGNQADQVNISAYKKSDVISFQLF